MTSALSSHHAKALDKSFKPLMEYVISATGLMYYSDRRREFAGHLSTRLQALGMDNCFSYLQLLQSGASGKAELDRLITLLTIGETHFFRHRELFQALESTVLPNLIEKNRSQRRLRIWSAGCSIGAEAYSISMLLRRRFASLLSRWDIRIIGTDINRDYLARASAAQFEDWALRAVSDEERQVCFLPDGKRWTVKPQYQQDVTFEYHNLAASPFSSPLKDAPGFDLIVCRNVMIYFSQDVVRQAIKNLHGCLVPDGWLVVGHAEHNLDWFRSFRTSMSNGAVLYQKQDPSQVDDRGSIEAPVSMVELPPVSEHWRADNVVESPQLSSAAAMTPLGLVPPPAAQPRDADRSKLTEKQDRLQKIRTLADRGELDEALARCRDLQASDMRDPSPHFYQALILQQTDDEAGAEQALKRALYLDRHCLLAHYYLGLLWQKQGATTRATRSFQNVLNLLADRLPEEPVADADELTVDDLKRLSASHLAVLEQR